MGWYIVAEDRGLRFSQYFGTYQPKYAMSRLHILHRQSKTNQPNKFTQTKMKTTQQPTNPHYKQKITHTTKQLKLVAII